MKIITVTKLSQFEQLTRPGEKAIPGCPALQSFRESWRGWQMEKLISDLKKHRDTPPKITYNKNDKHISVIHNFNHGYIPRVWLRADREIWLEWYYKPERITYETVNDYLSRTSKNTKAELKQYVSGYPQDFDGDMRFCINHTLPYTKHPGSDKARGGSPYGLSWEEINEIRNTARHLYISIIPFGNRN